ncbi:MAG: hypothetical protein V4513_03540 [Pseudomonadota bacterium]
MASVAKRLQLRSAALAACALASVHPAAAHAQSEPRLFTADAFQLSGDIRLVAVDGERSWVDGGFGKLRSGSDGDFQLSPQLGNLSLVWQPQFTFSFGATVVGSVQGGQRTEAGLSEAYLSFRPMRGTHTAFSARAGLMWPPVSLEHEGADWHVADSITPSAINSWIGEEVRPIAGEATLATDLGEHKLRATAAVMVANDTSGTLLTFRGWALHDRVTLASNRQPLPPLGPVVGSFQPAFTHPLLDVHPGFARHPGYYGKLSWQPPLPVRIELFRYDNEADPEDANQEMEWGWRTQFTNLSAVALLGGTTLKAQAMEGRTRMGFVMAGRRWIDCDFRSAFLLASHAIGPFSITARGEAFETRNSGSIAGEDYDEGGWALTVAGKRSWGPVTGKVELLHVSSRREDRDDVGLAQRQEQTQLQAQMRIGW